MADDKSVSWEVVKILNHKGGVGDRLYLVEWKGGFKPTWEPESVIQTMDCIQDYWDAKKKSKSTGKRKGSKGGGCGWRGYEREEKEGEREVDNLSTCGCVIQLYLWENTRFIEIREFGWGFLMLTS